MHIIGRIYAAKFWRPIFGLGYFQRRGGGGGGGGGGASQNFMVTLYWSCLASLLLENCILFILFLKTPDLMIQFLFSLDGTSL